MTLSVACFLRATASFEIQGGVRLFRRAFLAFDGSLETRAGMFVAVFFGLARQSPFFLCAAVPSICYKFARVPDLSRSIRVLGWNWSAGYALEFRIPHSAFQNREGPCG